MTLTQLEKLQFRSTDEYSLESRVGNTPLIQIRSLTRELAPAVRVLAKAEWFNPGGSIKDRPALGIIRAALKQGKLTPGRRLLDSTSGNTGISYATFGAAMGIPVTLCLPANASPERISMLRALGAELILTDPADGSDGAIREARKMAKAQPDRYWYANQYDNPANWQAHYLTTGPEILAQTNGEVTHLVAGLGTSGTMMGTGRYLRERLPDVKIVAVQPDEAFHGLEGLKHMKTAIKPDIYEPSFADRVIEVRTEEAHEMVRQLGRREGLFAGISSGAAMAAALRVASELREGVVVTIFPDAGYKYLSDRGLWEG
jgi:S-sulfo-L-cysteine synthase (O-acetyl-L-serine-dependent)